MSSFIFYLTVRDADVPVRAAAATSSNDTHQCPLGESSSPKPGIDASPDGQPNATDSRAAGISDRGQGRAREEGEGREALG